MSKNKNLVFISDKTKFIIFTTNKPKIRNTDFEFQRDNATALTRTDSTKIFGVYFQQQLDWDDHITELSKACYPTLSEVQKIKRSTPFNLRKHRCESLVLSKLSFCRNVFNPLMIIQQRRLQKIRNSCTALVFNRCCSVSDVIRVTTDQITYWDENGQLMLSSPTQKNLSRILKIKFCTKKTFVTSM